MTAGLIAEDHPKGWHLYLLRCAGDRYYAGITNDLPKRMGMHAKGLGAKFTRAFPPLGVLATRPYPDKSSALKAECALKALPRHRKTAFFAVDAQEQLSQ